MYPFELDDEEELAVVDAENEQTIDEPPTEYGIDFKTGQLTGGKVTGKKAVAVWVWCALQYRRYGFELSTWDYGCELSDLIGKVMTKQEAIMRAEAIVRDTLSVNPYIEDIKDFECDLNGDKLTISFKLDTTFGEEELSNVTV